MTKLWTDGRTDGQMEGQTDRQSLFLYPPFFIEKAGDNINAELREVMLNQRAAPCFSDTI
jgi:hypothetical protein